MNLHLVRYSAMRLQQGIGLIELMISMLIGLFVMAGVLQLFSTTGQNAVASAGLSRVQENSRYVFNRIAEDIAQSGNLGCVSTSYSNDFNVSFIENLLGLASGVDEAYDFTSILDGDQAATALSVPAGQVVTDTDTLQVRFVNHRFKIPLSANLVAPFSSVNIDSTDADYSRLRQYDIVALSNCSQGAIFVVTNDPTNSGGQILFDTTAVPSTSNKNPGQFNMSGQLEQNPEGYRMIDGVNATSNPVSPTYLYGGTTGAHLYYVGTSVAADDAGRTCAPAANPEDCALFRRHQGQNEELVEGVSNMQVWFGWTDAAGNLFYSRADGVTSWGRVDRVRVEIDFNSIDPVRSVGNTVDTDTTTGLITRTIERTFNLPNQL